MLSPGDKAPIFELPDSDMRMTKSSDLFGQKNVVMYFYPKDDTPGCTTEACSFRDNYSAYIDAGVVILGVSPDTSKSHARFKEKYTLPFPLLADEGHKVCELYGVWGPKKMMGREYEGVLRTTFLIDKDGKVAQVFENVKPSEHSAEVLAAINSL